MASAQAPPSAKRSPHPPSLLLRYGCAVLTVALATLVRMSLHSILKDNIPFTFYFISILFTVWYGGLAPALLSVVLSALAATYFFVPPEGMLAFADSANQLAVVVYMVVG